MASYSATESLFRQSVPPELDPALLLTELRGLRPLIDRLSRLQPLVSALEQLTVADVQAVACAARENETVIARVEHLAPQLHRIEEVIALLDELEVLVRRQ
jgi:hypothetical protein